MSYSNQSIVEHVVVAGRVGQHSCIQRRALVPEPGHYAVTTPSCSRGLSALRSATTKVPVPSLVNISARRLSEDL